MSENKKYKYIDVAIAYKGESSYGKYISVIFSEDVSFKAGDKIFFNENKYKGENEKAPDFKYARLNPDFEEEKQDPSALKKSAVKAVEEGELPF